MKIVTTKYRGKIAETCHIANAVAVNQKGDVLFSAGEENYPAFLNEVDVPFRTLTLLREKVDNKYDFSDKDLALFSSKHKGEEQFVKNIKSIVEDLDIDPKNMLCKEEVPEDNSSYERLIIQGKRPTAFHNAQSGVHAGMLALDKADDDSVSDYTSFNHPVQTQILDTVKDYTNEEEIYREVDNNGVPTFTLPLKNIAGFYCDLIKKDDKHLKKITEILAKDNEFVNSEDTFPYVFSEKMKEKGLTFIASSGLLAMGLRSKSDDFIGIAVKTLSGDIQAAISMAMEIISHLKLLKEDTLEQFEEFHEPKVTDKAGETITKVETDIRS